MSRVEQTAGADRSEGLERLRDFLSPHVGIVRSCNELLVRRGEARMTFVACEMAPRTLTLDSALDMAAASANYNREDAVAAGLGEAVERYCGSFVPQSRLVLASAAELGPQAVTPERFALYREDQYAQDGFPFEPFTSDTKVFWTEGWSIPDGEKVYLPEQLVYLRYRQAAGLPGETPIGIASSNGMALGLSREDAMLRGLLEAIERDAVMLTWANRLALPRLDWSGDEEALELERRHFAASGVAFDVIDLSVWCGVPTALAIHSGGKGPVSYAMGAASAPTMQGAWDKAVRECFQGVTMIRFPLAETPNPSFRADFSDIETPDDHCLFYLLPENQPQAAFLQSSEEVRDTRDVDPLEGSGPMQWIESICRRFEALGISAYAVDVTTPDVQEAGLHVVKVLSPELQQIDFVHRFRYLGGRRLYDAAHELGLRDAALAPDQVNPYPHPFP